MIYRERLVETVSRSGESEGLHMLQSLPGPSQDPQSALGALDTMIVRESSTLAQQDLFLLVAAAMILMAVGVLVAQGRQVRLRTGPRRRSRDHARVPDARGQLRTLLRRMVVADPLSAGGRKA